MSNFIIKPTGVPFIKIVIYGEPKTGKSTFAKNFVMKSCEIRKSNNCILFDTENGWDWIKQNMPENINFYEPPIININNYVNEFNKIEDIVNQENISCLVIDSISKIGEMLSDKMLDEANKQRAKSGKAPKDEISFFDYEKKRQKEQEIIDIIRKLKCDVILCGRISSQYGVADGIPVLKQITDRKLQNFSSIEYEFDANIVCDTSFDASRKDNIKNFSFIIKGSRIGNDGERITNGTELLNNWFSKIRKPQFDEAEIIQNILTKENQESLNDYYKFLLEVYGKHVIANNQTIMAEFTKQKQKIIKEQKIENNDMQQVNNELNV